MKLAELKDWPELGQLSGGAPAPKVAKLGKVPLVGTYF